MNEGLVIDRERFRLTAETPEEIAEVLALFMQIAQEKLDTMTASHDSQVWRHGAHYLKGSAANLGMTALAAVCQHWENTPPVTHEQHEQAAASIRHEITRVQQYFAY